jgi:hypothetical protein
MSAAYQHLALTDVKPGMILSDELLDQQGQVLLPKGALLTANMIALLPGHGIDMLAVLRSDGDGGAPAAAAPDPAATARRLDHLFRKYDPANADDWASAVLRFQLRSYRLAGEEPA